ncbi:MAG: ABC-F family ATP-binding cassette domain-containing protein [Bacteroidales bacterium]|nr:ABC-F family ATP-binding cassette domain-containing protein [Bacteroidales bacterium]
MLSLNDVTVSYGNWTLLDKISFNISETDKIGLTGKNGAGKTTIMKLICGLQNPTSGRIDLPAHYTVGYLPQIMEHHRGRTVLDETMTAFDALLDARRELDGISKELEQRTDYESDAYSALISRYNELDDYLRVSQSEPAEAQARRTLKGLGFKDDELGRLTDTFSQGWNMRIELAKILLRKPEILLLDEPTNHLDIESIEWLEDYLKGLKGGIMLVSHDRKFLDNVTNRTVEVMLGHVYDYKVPYSKYVELRAERLAQQTAAYQNQQKMIEKTEDFINRFRYKPTKSNQVQSRIKALEKLERLEIDETDNATLRVKFPPAPRSGDVAFKATNLTAGYPQKVVFRGADIEIKRGEKVALIGRNGEGKTTFMRILTGELDPIDGEAKVGHNVSIGYYAQNQEDVLDKNETVFSTLDRVATGDIRSRLRDLLAQFLFRGEDIDKRVSVLSGGERARLAMATLMLKSYNLLALDEPTNHMDIKSKDILKQALKAYDGTLIVVSHDRDFLDGLVDKFYEFEDGRVREHLETIAQFLHKRKIESISEIDRSPVKPGMTATQPVMPGSTGHPAPTKQERQMSYEELKQKSKEEKRIKNRIAALEKDIEKLEAQMKELEHKMTLTTEKDEILELTRSYLECKRELDFKETEWGELID